MDKFFSIRFARLIDTKDWPREFLRVHQTLKYPAANNYFWFFRDTPQRRNLIENKKPDNPEHFLLYGIDTLQKLGFEVQHNLEKPVPPYWLQRGAGIFNRWLHAMGAYGGDFASVLSCLRNAWTSKRIISTVDSLGLPLVLLATFGIVRVPIVYVSIGLPFRLKRMQPATRHFYRKAFRHVSRIIAYGYEEYEWLRNWIGSHGCLPRVDFVPFGVNTQYFRPDPAMTKPKVDILSVGADYQRDFALLKRFAWRHPGVQVSIITTGEHLSTLDSPPPNLDIQLNVPFGQLRGKLAEARIVALPVHENEYSGATTTLLQAMAMARPVVVSRVGAIRGGYGLRDGQNCLLVPPGAADDFEIALLHLLHDSRHAALLGQEARRHVEQYLSWERYEARMIALVTGTDRGTREQRRCEQYP